MRISPYVHHQDHCDRAGCSPNVEVKSIAIFTGYSKVPLQRLEPSAVKVASTVVRPAKAGEFSRRQDLPG